MKEISKRTFIVVILLSCKVMVEIISSLKVADLEKEKMFSSTNEELNYPPYVASQRGVENWSLQGLSKRATMVRAQFIDEGNNTWTLKEVCVLNDDCRSIDPNMNHIIMTPYDITYCNTRPEYLLLFIILNPENISRLADRGPQAKTPEVAAWQQLWGSKSELRRYKDGSIQYTNCK